MKATESFTRRVPLSKPEIGPEEHAAMRGPLERGWVTQGPEVEAFEKEFAGWVGASHACAVSSGTTALFLAMRTAGVSAGDEVITVSHSFIATANSIRHLGAVPVFIDIDPRTFNINPSRIVAAISPRTKAILCVHQIGMPCDLGQILRIASNHRLPVIEDAACALGSQIRSQDGAWEQIGRPHGDLACFSFHPRKIITTGDGGMVTTNNPALADRLKLQRNHGMNISPMERHKADHFILEKYTTLGYNFRLTDIQAAMGRVQMGRLPGILDARKRLAERYHERLADFPDIQVPFTPDHARSNWQSYCVRLSDRIDAVRLMTGMIQGGVSVKGGVMCSHREPAYLDDPASYRISGNLLQSEVAQDRCMLLPIYSQMTADDQDYVLQVLKGVLSSALM